VIVRSFAIRTHDAKLAYSAFCSMHGADRESSRPETDHLLILSEGDVVVPPVGQFRSQVLDSEQEAYWQSDLELE
jgi:hypothetical protein